ncbi:MAG: 50S ribosomal protein L25 [bacterium]
MSELLLKVEARDHTGKQISKKLRREGKVPGIFYIHGEKTMPFSIDEKQLHNAIHTEISILDLQFGSGKKTKCVIRDIQWHPLADKPIHVDLMGVKMTEEVQVDVTVHLVGEAIGIKRDGGVLQQVLRDISISCLPADIPEHIEFDITKMEIGDTVHIEDLDLGDVKILNDLTQTIAVIRAPRVEAEPVVEVDEAEEPEVVGEKQEDAGEEGEQKSQES